MTFNPLTDPVDYIELAGERSPGIAVIENASSPRRWDERRGFAMSGARVVYRGLALAHFTVTLKLYTAEDFQAWDAWRPLVDRPPVGVYARAKDIWHPILEDLGIKAVVVEEYSQPTQTDDGEWSIVIKFIEYRRPMPQLSPIDGTDKPEFRLASTVVGQIGQIETLTGQLMEAGMTRPDARAAAQRRMARARSDYIASQLDAGGGS